MNRLPNLFIIGGMKCGSSTLYADLALHPDIHAPTVKEPTFLEQSGLNDSEISALYQNLHDGGEHAVYRMDGSTRHSMREQIPNAANRISAICGENCRIVYVVREPVSRIVSHYKHAFSTGSVSCSLAEALDSVPALIDNTCYARQLEPWVVTFGEKQIFVIEFGSYVADRLKACNAVLDFLELDPLPDTTELPTAQNVSAGRRNPPRWLSNISRKPFYKNKIAPVLPMAQLSLLKQMFYRRAPEAKPLVDESLRESIYTRLDNEITDISSYCSFPKTEGKLW